MRDKRNLLEEIDHILLILLLYLFKHFLVILIYSQLQNCNLLCI